MTKNSSKSNENIVFNGKIGEVVHTTQKDGRVFERYRRAPGVRLIIKSEENKILITKEHRHESNNYDLRLPGGKVRDTIKEFHELLESGDDMNKAAQEAAIKEAMEETGIIVKDIELVEIAHAGATVEWDLYYFIVQEYQESPNGQELEHGEDIEVLWMSIDEIERAIANDKMQEWCSVGVLLGKILPKIRQE